MLLGNRSSGDMAHSLLRRARVVVLAFLTSLAGLFCAFSPWCCQPTLDMDLAIWFALRGTKSPPQEVAIVNLGSESAARLGLPDRPEKWPRTIYADLIEGLSRLGVAVIAMDIYFPAPRGSTGDKLLARAMKRAGNVVLFEYMKRRVISLDRVHGPNAPRLMVETIVPPLSLFEKSAAATAPFPLPKVPVRLNRFWAFKSAAGDAPTLPVVALYVSALNRFDGFLRHLGQLFPEMAPQLPENRNEALKNRQVEILARRLRQYLLLHGPQAEEALNALAFQSTLGEEGERKFLRAVIMACMEPEAPFLNFYGPPGTLRIIPGYKVLECRDKGECLPDLKNKAVFIGAARQEPSEQKDGFYTVFTRSDGLDLSGVEIAATAFSNLLEGETLRPLNQWLQALVICFWGTFIILVAFFIPPAMSVLAVVSASALYLFTGLFLFINRAVFLPFVTPVLFPGLVAYGLSVLWQYIRVSAERRNINEAFLHYLPSRVVNSLARDRAFIKRPPQMLYGICLMTDAERYTTLSEHMDPGKLAALMNSYYERIFEPVKRHGGIVSDVLGDSMLAIWTGTKPAGTLKTSAARAALEIMEAAARFNAENQSVRLPTRIGLHSGYLALGHLGALDHYEFTPIGDIVNTASRIEGLNKYLGTRILASAEVLDNASGLLTRELGTFLLAGKSIPVVIYEIISTVEDSTLFQMRLCELFVRALRDFRDKKWQEAARAFRECGEDGPARFYLGYCMTYLKTPPPDDWTGIIKLDRK